MEKMLNTWTAFLQSILSAIVVGLVFGSVKMYNQIVSNQAEINQLKADRDAHMALISATDTRVRSVEGTVIRIDENVKELLRRNNREDRT